MPSWELCNCNNLQNDLHYTFDHPGLHSATEFQPIRGLLYRSHYFCSIKAPKSPLSPSQIQHTQTRYFLHPRLSTLTQAIRLGRATSSLLRIPQIPSRFSPPFTTVTVRYLLSRHSLANGDNSSDFPRPIPTRHSSRQSQSYCPYQGKA